MCPLPGDSRSDSESSFEGETDFAEPAPRHAQVSDYTLIQRANQKTRLLTILKSYGIRPIRVSQYSDWSELLVCPLQSHKGGNERTPSFGYNFVEDRFNCFGCAAAGRTVEFISARNGISKTLIAEQILRETEGYDFDDSVEEDENPRIEKALFEFSTYVHSLIRMNRGNAEALEQIDKIIWWIDLYLVSKAPKNKVSVEELEHRISTARELLDHYAPEPPT